MENSITPKFGIGDVVYDVEKNFYIIRSIHIDVGSLYYDIGDRLVREAELYTLEEVTVYIATAVKKRLQEKLAILNSL